MRTSRRGTEVTHAYKRPFMSRLLGLSFLILIARFATLESMVGLSVHPCTIPMIMVSSATPGPGDWRLTGSSGAKIILAGDTQAVSAPCPDRGASMLVRVYVDARVAAPVHARSTRQRRPCSRRRRRAGNGARARSRPVRTVLRGLR
jgi:hypothetical protein